jgi:hypothetical protein
MRSAKRKIWVFIASSCWPRRPGIVKDLGLSGARPRLGKPIDFAPRPLVHVDEPSLQARDTDEGLVLGAAARSTFALVRA